jgi:hypothetical protein
MAQATAAKAAAKWLRVAVVISNSFQSFIFPVRTGMPDN